MFRLLKKIILLCLFTPRFFIEKFINVAKLFLRGREVTHYSERMLMGEGSVHVKQTVTNKEEWGSKNENFE